LKKKDLLKGVKKHVFHQAVQKRLDARRAWFDKLTMTICKPVLSLPKEGTQRNTADERFSTAC
jgi:hypothetical protein